MGNLLKDKKESSILFIDDEEHCCDVFEQQMSEFYIVKTCNSPIEALKLVKNNTFDVIVVDQHMPEMSGINFLARIHKNLHDTAFIIVTGYSDTDEILNAINDGRVFYYIKKPWSLEDLEMLIKKAIDNTKLKKHEKECEDFISASFDQATVGMAHLMADGNFIRVNKKFCNILSSTEEYIKSKSIYNLVSSDDDNNIQFIKLFDNSKSNLIYEVNLNKQLSGKVMCKLTLSLVKNNNQQPIYIVAILENIEKNKAIEKEQHISHNILSQLPNGVIVTDMKGTINRWTGESPSIFGYKENEVIGKDVEFILDPIFKKEITEEITLALSTKNFFHKDIHCLKKDGTEIIVEQKIVTVIDNNGAPFALVGICQDITKRKNTEGELNNYKENLEEMVNSRTNELKEANLKLQNHAIELENFNKTMVGREMRIIELKNQVNQLSLELGRDLLYPPIWEETE